MEDHQRGFWTKSYGRSALICFLIFGGTMETANNATDTALPLLVNDAAVIGTIGFTIAAVVRAIKEKQTSKS
jgi:hypothetical protein